LCLATAQKERIEEAITDLKEKTCINFVNRSSEQDYLSIESLDGCWSLLGMNGGKQQLSLFNNGCLSVSYI